MVLPDASDSSADPSDQSTYDFEPSSASPSPYDPQTIHMNIDPTTLPQPIPLLGRALGFTPQRALSLAAFTLADLQRLTGRPARDDEAQALTEAAFGSVRLMSQSAALGLTLGIVRARFKRDPFRYPFPLGLFGRLGPVDPDAARVPLLGTLKGPAARAWHRGLITAGHAFNGLALFGLAGVMAGAGVMASAEVRDPRLRDYHAATLRAARERMAHLRRGRGLPEPPPRPGARGTQGAQGRGESGDEAPADDASATGGRGMVADGYAAYQEPYREDEARRESERRDQTSHEDRSFSRRSPRRSAGAPPRGSPPAAEDAQSDSVFGDTRASANESSSGGSAWDRLRRNASSTEPSSAPSGVSGAQRAPRARQAPSSSDGNTEQEGGKSDDFSFSGAESDKQLAKEQAQRDFDALLERERQGEDEAGRGRRW